MTDSEAALPFAVHTLVGKRPGPHLLISAGVHGDEFEPMAAVRTLIATAAADQLSGRLTLIPCVNEAAFARGARTGPDGQDLARVCPGRPDGSTTERVAHALSSLIRSANYYIDLHTGGTHLRVLPLTGYSLHADAAVLASQRKMARAFNLPIIWGTDPSLEGRSLSVARDACVPAIYAEYHGGGSFDPNGASAYVEGCWNVMAILGMCDRPQPADRVRHIVEDARSGSGHMQVAHPSPAAGFFEPCVTIGENVAAGARLGTVTDELGRARHEVLAQHGGIVLTLHTFARVERGEGLAVVLEVSGDGRGGRLTSSVEVS